MEEKITTVRAVGRALAILKCFTPEKSKIGLSELSRMADLPKSTVFRLMNSLKQGGFILEDRGTETYGLSMLLFRLGNVAAADATVIGVAQPEMQEVSAKTLETVVLNVVVGDERVSTKVLDSQHCLRRFIKVGEGLPLVNGASGKLLLAYLPQEKQREIYQNSMFAGLIDKTQDDFLTELQAIKSKGYYHSKDERIIGASAVSAPIFDSCGDCVAGLTVSGATVRFTPEKVEQFVSLVTQATKTISEKLGFERCDHG